MKNVAAIVWAVAVLAYAWDVLGRLIGVWGFTLRAEDAIALLLIAGVASLIWRPRA